MENESDNQRKSRTELRELLRNPCMLNLVCGLFALERVYAVMAIATLKPEYGHYIAVVVYTLGFLLGLASLWEPAPSREPGTSQLRNLMLAATGASYALLVLGSLWLLFIVYIDIGVNMEAMQKK